MFRITICSFATAAALVLAGCNAQTDRASQTKTSEGQASTAPAGEDSAKRDRALVRFVNAAPNQQSLDLWFGDTKAFSGVGYKSVSAYMELPTERRTFSIRSADGTTQLATNNEGLWDGRHYTLVAMPKEDGSITLHAMNDDLAAPSEGKAKVRVVNAAPRVDDVDLVATSKRNELIEDVDFNAVSDFKEVDPVTGGVEIRRDNNKVPALRLGDMNLAAGKMYTIIVTGTSANKLDSIRIEDQVMGQPQPGM